VGKKIKEDQLIVIINSNLLPSSFQTSEVSHNKDKLRSFLWKGTLDANGGHCLVKWNKGLRLKTFGAWGYLILIFSVRHLG